jgi:hypothetical protein
MSFDLACKNCGANSGPSVGVCPFCKTVMAPPSANAGAIGGLENLYTDGRLDLALSTGLSLLKTKPEAKTDLSFVLVLLKIMIEAEAPTTSIRSLIAEALLHHPGASELNDTLELLDARSGLKKGKNDVGELMLRNLIRRSPNNVHAHFFLGTHFFWTDEDPMSAVAHLETCVRLHPKFLRAWGCLGAIYKKLGHVPLAKRAFETCVALESNPKMKELFLQQIRELTPV